ncbi:FAD-binding oxidoreductase [Microbacterium sp. CnD16-F]|uniref:NAD(P)/FAD-dependent oxidoreductase n=1 Tax=Microbacterium sp. CnD16-F TaxID=2954493 RepID=UPI0020978A0D|nr:FAD-dependent oxidoreductase [Microbacterium sp. CnD16-F]MCO7204018.1 FAD-binding oxidoreductase [Microbacterium sp. CnD16-F]
MTTVSHWWRDHGAEPARAPLPGDLDVDVAIVGAGYTGLWTAYYLTERRPDLRIAVIERRFAGFGASGRNGGWLTNSVTGGRERYGRDGGIRQQRAMNDTVDEVIRVATAEGIDADVRAGGELTIARSPAQLARLDAMFASESAWPGTDVERWDAARTAEHVRVAGTLGAVWHPHCARIHPVKLLTGLATAVERRGVSIFEDTAVAEILPGRAVTDRGTVRASAVIRATEGFTTDLRGERRTWLPMNSSMIVTAPLPEEAWEQIGWTDAATLGDAAHVYMYAQRTADGRIAFGGRGVPYRFGSRIDTDGATPASTVTALTELLRRFFPAASGVPVEDAWSGVLGVPRDWAATVGFDRASGLGWAGGYVGTGVATTNLAGRTLADLVLGEQSDLVSLPWVGHRARRWEPEPLRWLAVRGIYGAYRFADAHEDRGGGTSPVARIADLIAGR